MQLGVPATCNAGGAGKWKPSLDEFCHDADDVVVPDPQKKHPKTGRLQFHPDGKPVLPGQDHARSVASALHGVAKRVRLLELWQHWPDLPLKDDVSNWIDNGGTAEALYALIEKTPNWSPPDEHGATEHVPPKKPKISATPFRWRDPAARAAVAQVEGDGHACPDLVKNPLLWGPALALTGRNGRSWLCSALTETKTIPPLPWICCEPSRLRWFALGTPSVSLWGSGGLLRGH
jgi:hypothetical protein